jgi:acyl carrier protein
MNEKVLQCVYAAIDEANEDRQGDLPPLEKSVETPIHGTASGLDSLGLINFVVAVEEGVERELGTEIVLSDDRSLSQEPSPFESVGALVDYIDVLLSEQRQR